MEECVQSVSSRVCTVACLGQEMEKDKADKVAARLAKKAEAAARRESAEPPSAPRTPGLLASELPVALAIPLPSPEPPMATPMTPAPITTPAPNAEGPPTGTPTQAHPQAHSQCRWLGQSARSA